MFYPDYSLKANSWNWNCWLKKRIFGSIWYMFFMFFKKEVSTNNFTLNDERLCVPVLCQQCHNFLQFFLYLIICNWKVVTRIEFSLLVGKLSKFIPSSLLVLKQNKLIPSENMLIILNISISEGSFTKNFSPEV